MAKQTHSRLQHQVRRKDDAEADHAFPARELASHFVGEPKRSD